MLGHEKTAQSKILRVLQWLWSGFACLDEGRKVLDVDFFLELLTHVFLEQGKVAVNLCGTKDGENSTEDKTGTGIVNALKRMQILLLNY